mmetsp:Transcript_34748/g.87154  ORF Transcript_34748/g.87154 Transcript_34748/m.87154 type:complete len:208 (+) Transcript_34748:902-1525(+)
MESCSRAAASSATRCAVSSRFPAMCSAADAACCRAEARTRSSADPAATWLARALCSAADTARLSVLISALAAMRAPSLVTPRLILPPPPQLLLPPLPLSKSSLSSSPQLSCAAAAAVVAAVASCASSSAMRSCNTCMPRMYSATDPAARPATLHRSVAISSSSANRSLAAPSSSAAISAPVVRLSEVATSPVSCRLSSAVLSNFDCC